MIANTCVLSNTVASKQSGKAKQSSKVFLSINEIYFHPFGTIYDTSSTTPNLKSLTMDSNAGDEKVLSWNPSWASDEDIEMDDVASDEDSDEEDVNSEAHSEDQLENATKDDSEESEQGEVEAEPDNARKDQEEELYDIYTDADPAYRLDISNLNAHLASEDKQQAFLDRLQNRWLRQGRPLPRYIDSN